MVSTETGGESSRSALRKEGNSGLSIINPQQVMLEGSWPAPGLSGFRETYWVQGVGVRAGHPEGGPEGQHGQ